MKKIEIPENGRVTVKWRTLPIDYTDENKAVIISKMAKKYGISKDRITVEPQLITKNTKGDIIECDADSIVGDMRNPMYHRVLYREYLDMKEAKDYDFNRLCAIDDLINGNIDYEKYGKYKKYDLKWIKWSNFMSYGEDNFFDFTKLHGITLLQSEPANQGGKSTFCLDLFRFLLYGKVVCREDDWVLARAFNDYRPEATEVVVEGCIESEGEEYVIKRTLTRPALKKRTEKSKVTQKVNYYKLINGQEYVDLVDESEIEQKEGMTNVETNKIIKEIIGNEDDFDLMICINSGNLEDLIDLKDTDRGRLLSRWVGLLPLEEKDKIAREIYNRQIVPNLMMNRYNKDDLTADIEARKEENKGYETEIQILNKRINECTEKLKGYQSTRDGLLEAKTHVDDSLLKVDVFTLQKSIDDIVEKGKLKRAEKEKNENDLKEIGTVEYDENEYQEAIANDKALSMQLTECTNDYKHAMRDVEMLKKSEFCPTCGQRLKNVDNSEKITAKEKEIAKLIEKGKELREKSTENAARKQELEEKRQLNQKRTRVELLIATNDVDINKLLVQYKEKSQLMKDIEANKSAIEANNKIDVSLNIANENIATENRIITNCTNDIASYKSSIESNLRECTKMESIIETITKEEDEVKHWKMYLDLVGKNGVSKLVLKNTLPLINSELERMMSDVCDFIVYVDIDERNDVKFYKIHDGVKTKIGGGSGFEKTVASLALRGVLGKISTFSKPSFVIFDEVWSAVAKENSDKLHLLYDKLIKDYRFIFIISHNDVYKEWANNFITIVKEKNISKIKDSII